MPSHPWTEFPRPGNSFLLEGSNPRLDPRQVTGCTDVCLSIFLAAITQSSSSCPLSISIQSNRTSFTPDDNRLCPVYRVAVVVLFLFLYRTTFTPDNNRLCPVYRVAVVVLFLFLYRTTFTPDNNRLHVHWHTWEMVICLVLQSTKSK